MNAAPGRSYRYCLIFNVFIIMLPKGGTHRGWYVGGEVLKNAPGFPRSRWGSSALASVRTDANAARRITIEQGSRM